MFEPNRLLALNNTIGLLVVAAMNPQRPDVESVLGEFRLCLNDYERWAENFWSGWALDVEQVFKVGNDVRLSAPLKPDKPVSSVVAQCSAAGSLTLVHMFDAARFVPIGNTPVMLEPVIAERDGELTLGEPVHETIGPSGILEVSGCPRGQRYRITFFPDVSAEHVKVLYASYQGLLDGLEGWLRAEWSNQFEPLWKEFASGGFLERYGQLQEADWRGVGNSLQGVWDEVKQVYELLADLQANSEKLLEYISQAELDALLDASAEAIANGLLVLSDEPLLFIHLAALTSWLKMLPPQFAAEVVAQIRTDLLIAFLLTIVTRRVGLKLGLSAKILGKIKSPRARQWLAAATLRLSELSSDSRLDSHAAAFKPLAVNARQAPLRPTPTVPLDIRSDDGTALRVKNPAAIARKKSDAQTRMVRQEPHDDAPEQAKNTNGDSADCAPLTCTNGCPVSMVTGEELLTLTDGALDGVLPFDFTRLYRTSAAELDCGLGWGWSHSLAHRLEFDGDKVVWIDHENRRTPFPLPNIERPAIHNSLSRAAIYLGDNAQELIVAMAGEAPRFYHFHNGQLTAISDAYDNRLLITRDRMERIQRLDNGAGRSLLLSYERGHLIAIEYQLFRPADTLSDGWRTEQTLVSYRYDARHHLVEVANAAGESERYDYDDQHVILQRQLPGGASYFWEWERSGKAARCIRHRATFSQMDTAYTWDDQGGVVVKNVDGSEETYVHDDKARLVRRVEPGGGEHRKRYDEQGRLIAEQDPLGAITHYRYDDIGRLIASIPPESEPTSYEYRNGFLHARRRGKAVWKYQRNAEGDVTEATDPDGQVTHYHYDARGRLLSTRYPDASRHLLVWNDLGQLVEETLPDGGQRYFSYDSLGRRATSKDEHGAITAYRWDAIGRLIQTTLPTGATRAFSYNAYGKVTAEQDELGRITRYEYADDLHLVSRRTNPDGTQLSYRYDNAQLLLTEIENESGEKYQLDYTPDGLIRQETGFDGQRTAYAYDAGGHLLKKTEFGDDGSQLITGYQRDASGRLLVKTLPDASTVEYRYDSLGRLVSVDDSHDHPLEFEYDLQDRLITEHQGWGTLRYGYDACGQLNHMRLPDGSKLAYHHAKGGALTAIDLNGAQLTTHTFSAGREQQRQQGLLLSDYQYDEQGRLKAHSVSQQRQPLYRRDYAYSANGNLDRIADTRHGQRSYQYDALDRLIRVRHSRDHLPESFAHDPAGNLLMPDRPGAAKVLGNRLLMQGDRHYDYDAFGNLIRERRGTAQKLVTEYRYDCQHRLVGVTLPDGRCASYRYDAFGRRIAKTVDGKTTEFFWQGDHLVAESSHEHHRSYVYEPGTFRPLAMLDGKGSRQACPFYYQLDHLGTPQELTDYSGEIVWAAQYTAHGRLTRLNRDTDQVLDQPLRFQGQYFDAETGLHYNRHRYYNPDVGRYLTPDPVKLAGGVNGYRYAVNPTGWVDPLGLSDCPGGDGCDLPGDGCDLPGDGGEDPAGKVRVDEGEPALPDIVRNVDPNSLRRVHAIEGKSSTKRVEDVAGRMQANGFDDDWPIDVVEHEGERYIVDGHHRASAARRTHTPVTIKLITDIAAHKKSIFTTVEEVKESADSVGLDRLTRPRR
ncbi:RHS repeat-associated core domain-containing protein [Pseudomonas prosekii]|uniref:RHS repeat-associated core domain-containing protein n=1 Tax=Pseudomonas prosekii TaxID=1148509 RepID=A0A1H1PN21_9PSED|nr:RHS repeat-associated core domain-containing protein [Pseudomonas prosekii]SDS12681.1 RHS repeat-associated core domain-containing protein [Pseudomonas prosekii]